MTGGSRPRRPGAPTKTAPVGDSHARARHLASGRGVLHAGLAAILCGIATGCSSAGAFECQTDFMCNTGRCEATGWCSFPDAQCVSGSRYGGLAGGGLGGACVPADPTQEPGSTSSPASDGGDDASTMMPPDAVRTDATSTISGSVSADEGTSTAADGPAATCGDGSEDVGEDCDDGNALNGDGCDVDCTPSGETIWTRTAGGNELPDGFHDLVILESGDVGVVGGLAFSPVFQAYALDDGGSSGPLALGVPFAAAALGLAISHDSIVAGGTSIETVDEGFIAVLDAATTTVSQITIVDFQVVDVVSDSGDTGMATGSRGGAPVVISFFEGTMEAEVSSPPLPAIGSGMAVALSGSGLILAAGHNVVTEEAYLRAVMFGDPTPHWQLSLEAGSFGTIFGISLGSGEHVIVSGSVFDEESPVGVVAVVDSLTGLVAWERTLVPGAVGGFASIRGAASGPAGEVVGAGCVQSEGGSSSDIWVGKYEFDGALLWERVFTGDGAGDSCAAAVAVHDDGSITVVGTIQNDTPDAWVAHLEP